MSTHTRRLAGRLARTVERIQQLPRARDLLLTDNDLVEQIELPWYRVVRNAAEDDLGDDPSETVEPDSATVYILDEIGGSMGVKATNLVREINALDVPQINVQINSPGGSVFDALAIYNALILHPANVTSYVMGIAASAASVITMAGTEVVMMPGSQLMIHDASAMQEGNAADMAAMSTFLDRQSQNVAERYQARAGGTADEWRAIMLAETWMMADEAVEMGLADRVETAPAKQESRNRELAHAMTRSFDMSRFGYRGRVQAPRRGLELPVRQERARTHARTAPGVMSDEDGRHDVTVSTQDSKAAAAARGEAVERRAHALAQEGRRVPVLRTSDLFQTKLRVARCELPLQTGAARIQGFGASLQVAATVQRGGRELAHVAGYASMYGKSNAYEMWDAHGPYLEFVRARAGSESLANGPDVAFLTNHAGITMARTRNGTLELADDELGLADDAYVNPERKDVADLLTAIADGEVTEQSFAFMIMQGGWSPDFEYFEVVQYDIDRGDVSAVNFGANPYTSIAARGQMVLADLDRLPESMARAALARLARRTDVAATRFRRADAIELASRGEQPRQATVEAVAAALELSPAELVRPAVEANVDRVVPTGRRITAIEAWLDSETR